MLPPDLPCLCFSFSLGTVGFRTEGDAGKQAQDRSAKVGKGRRQGDEYADYSQKFGDKVSVPRDATGTSFGPKDSLGKAEKDTPSSRQIQLVAVGAYNPRCIISTHFSAGFLAQ